jgi:hypothetical protein
MSGTLRVNNNRRHSGGLAAFPKRNACRSHQLTAKNVESDFGFRTTG